MIITDSVRCCVEIAQPVTDDMMEFTQTQCRAQIVRAGEGIGAFIRPESVIFASSENEGNLTLRLDATWCPDPREGVEFRGGGADGRILRIGSTHQRPPERWVIPEEGDSEFSEGLGPVSPGQHHQYKLSGIDSERDRWVYSAM